jgi:hypothetical protein
VRKSTSPTLSLALKTLRSTQKLAARTETHSGRRNLKKKRNVKDLKPGKKNTLQGVFNGGSEKRDILTPLNRVP